MSAGEGAPVGPTASAYSESQPVLESRLAKAGFDAGDVTKIVAQVKSLKQLAFASSYTPGVADETPLMNVLQSMLGAGVSLSIAQKACFRAVYHEAYAIVTSEMRQQVERAEEPTIRHLSQPERAERIQKQRARLTGITTKGVSEPSEALVDVCVGMYESNVLKYVEWSKCTACDSKKDIRLTIDPGTSRLKVEAKTKQLEADASSEVLVMQALQRRALALDQANVVDFLALDAWHQKMLRARPPPGFMRVSFRQMIHADQKLFLELSDLTRAGIQATATGRPMDAQVPIASALHEVMCLLQALPLAGQA